MTGRKRNSKLNTLQINDFTANETIEIGYRLTYLRFDMFRCAETNFLLRTAIFINIYVLYCIIINRSGSIVRSEFPLGIVHSSKPSFFCYYIIIFYSLLNSQVIISLNNNEPATWKCFCCCPLLFEWRYAFLVFRRKPRLFKCNTRMR